MNKKITLISCATMVVSILTFMACKKEQKSSTTPTVKNHLQALADIAPTSAGALHNNCLTYVYNQLSAGSVYGISANDYYNDMISYGSAFFYNDGTLGLNQTTIQTGMTTVYPYSTISAWPTTTTIAALQASALANYSGEKQTLIAQLFTNMDNATNVSNLISLNNTVLSDAATAVTNGDITQADADQIATFASISDSSYSYWTSNNNINYNNWRKILGQETGLNKPKPSEIGKADLIGGVGGAIEGVAGGPIGVVAFGVLGAATNSMYTIFASLFW